MANATGQAKPSQTKAAAINTNQNCVGAKRVFNPPVPLYTFDNFSGTVGDLYAGDIGEQEFINRFLIPVAGLDYQDYVGNHLAYKNLASASVGYSNPIGRSQFIRIYIDKFISKSDQMHIKSWKNIVKWTSMFSMESVAINFVGKATAERIRSSSEKMDIRNRRYISNPQINSAVSNHPHLRGSESKKRNLQLIRKYLVAEIGKKGMNVNKYQGYHGQSNMIAKVKLNTFSNNMDGLAVLTNDTAGYKIEILSYSCLGPKKAEIRYRYTIYDHFGLDNEDLNLDKFHIIHPAPIARE